MFPGLAEVVSGCEQPGCAPAESSDQLCLHPAAEKLNFTAGSPKASTLTPQMTQAALGCRFWSVPVFSVTPGLHPALPFPHCYSWGRAVTLPQHRARQSILLHPCA